MKTFAHTPTLDFSKLSLLEGRHNRCQVAVAEAKARSADARAALLSVMELGRCSASLEAAQRRMDEAQGNLQSAIELADAASANLSSARKFVGLHRGGTTTTSVSEI